MGGEITFNGRRIGKDKKIAKLLCMVPILADVSEEETIPIYFLNASRCGSNWGISGPAFSG